MSHHQGSSVGDRRVLANLWRGIAVPSLCGGLMGAFLVVKGDVVSGSAIAVSMAALGALALNSAKAVMRNSNSPAQS